MNALSIKLFGLLCFFGISASMAQRLPIHFEKQEIKFTGSTNELNKPGFDGGVGEVVDNPNKSGINTSQKVGKITRNVGAVWAGSRIPLSRPFDFRALNVITFKIFTSAPPGTQVLLKLEDVNYAINGYSVETNQYTTTSNEWEELQFTFSQSATAFDNLVMMFDFLRMGNGEDRDVFYFDNITQTSREALDNPVEPIIDYGDQFKTNEDLSIEDEVNNTIKVFPNPSSSAWNIESEAVITQVEVIDLQGKQVLYMKPNQKSVRVAADKLANGLYLSKITTNSGIKRVKLIKH